MNPRFHFIFVSLLGLALISGCIFDSQSKVAGKGGSSETTNGMVVGYVKKSDASPAQNVRVILRTRNFLKNGSTSLPKTSLSKGETVTDAQGKYVFEAVEPGDYLLEANDQGKLGVVQDFSTGDKDTIALGSLHLKPTGIVVGTVNESLPKRAKAKVQIYGLDRLALVDSVTGRFIFSDLPEGTFTLRVSLSDSTLAARDIAGVNSQSADTNDIGNHYITSFQDEDYQTWPYSLRIQLNTTSSGANIANDVHDFPLLIRLNKGNFDFSRATAKNIRFSDPAGKHLHYQIERWNAAAQLAEIWVKMETIHGNSHSDFLTLHYGNNAAQDWSNGRQVFATENGFSAVWHLGEEAADTTRKGFYQDATPSAQNGDDRIINTETNGLIGQGHGFNFGDYIKAQPSVSLRPKANLYLSAWFRGKTTDSLGSSIVSLGDSYGLRVEPNGSVKFFIYKDVEAWFKITPAGVNVLDSAWHYLVGTFDGKFLRVFVDGIEVGSIASNAKIPYTLGPDFYIGRHGTSKREFDLIGQLDEVQVHSVARNADWVKLSFQSQRFNSTLLEFPSP
jgi:Concanavalin A-like lectin/glucanases superfamily/Domain of unknown function (DUF2341)